MGLLKNRKPRYRATSRAGFVGYRAANNRVRKATGAFWRGVSAFRRNTARFVYPGVYPGAFFRRVRTREKLNKSLVHRRKRDLPLTACLLMGVKRTFLFALQMSANDPKRTC